MQTVHKTYICPRLLPWTKLRQLPCGLEAPISACRPTVRWTQQQKLHRSALAGGRQAIDHHSSLTVTLKVSCKQGCHLGWWKFVLQLYDFRQNHAIEATIVSLQDVQRSYQWLQYSFILLQEVKFSLFQSRQHQSVRYVWSKLKFKLELFPWFKITTDCHVRLFGESMWSDLLMTVKMTRTHQAMR